MLQQGKTPWNKGIPLTSEVKKKLSDKMRGRIVPLSVRSKISESSSGPNSNRWNPNREEVAKNIKIQAVCRRLLHRTMKNRPKRWLPKENLGYTYDEFKKHIELTWASWMNWDNYGKYRVGQSRKWCIDHIIPIAEWIKRGITDPKMINDLTNLRALDSLENLKKREFMK